MNSLKDLIGKLDKVSFNAVDTLKTISGLTPSGDKVEVKLKVETVTTTGIVDTMPLQAQFWVKVNDVHACRWSADSHEENVEMVKWFELKKSLTYTTEFDHEKSSKKNAVTILENL